MALIIRTGFSNITHGIEFNPNVVVNGKALSVSHVVRVEELRSENVSEIIRGSVIPQTSVNSSPYKVQLHLSDKRHVVEASCTCASQAAAKCKHIYAVIHYVNSNRSLTKTSLEQEWGKPSEKQLGHEMYSKAMTMGKLFSTKTPINTSSSLPVSPLQISLQELTHPSALRTILKAYSVNGDERFVRGLLQELIGIATTMSDNEQCEACITSLLNFCGDHATYSSKQSSSVPNGHVSVFYEKEIVLNDNEIIEACVQTRRQSQSDRWFSLRNVRISGSSRAHAIKTRQRKSIDALINDFLCPSILKGTAKKNTQYGSKNEYTALKDYQSQYRLKVIEIGVVVSKAQPWLCASPDGVVIDGDMITRLVEIKCPISCAKLSVVDFDSNKANVNYLYLYNGNVELKQSHVYYTQCQVQLYVTGLMVCDLYIWSPHGSCLVPVHRDEVFLKNLIPKLEDFYFRHFLKILACSSGKNNKENNNPGVENDL